VEHEDGPGTRPVTGRNESTNSKEAHG
jgi:hypothetical protein